MTFKITEDDFNNEPKIIILGSNNNDKLISIHNAVILANRALYNHVNSLEKVYAEKSFVDSGMETWSKKKHERSSFEATLFNVREIKDSVRVVLTTTDGFVKTIWVYNANEYSGGYFRFPKRGGNSYTVFKKTAIETSENNSEKVTAVYFKEV